MIPRWLLALALAVAMLVAFACERSPSRPTVNLPPHVRITEGAPDSADVDYRVTFRWTGWDDDGAVDYYLYALDEGSRIARSGRGDDALTWQRIDGYGGTFRFEATTPDPDQPLEATDWSRFLIRAVDDDGDVSDIDERFFNTRTIAPEAHLVEDPLPWWYEPASQLCLPVRVRWAGEDLDATSPAHTPALYQLRLVRIGENDDPVTAVLAESIYEWFPDVGDSLTEQSWTLDFADLPYGRYAFAVRAIDEAGAVTPSQAFSLFPDDPEGNVVVLDSRNAIPSDRTTLYLASLNHLLFDGPLPQEQAISMQIARGIRVPLSWRMDRLCLPFGTTFEYSYALDIPDSTCSSCTDPDGIGGWAPARYGAHVGSDVPGPHTLHLRGTSDAVEHIVRIDLTVSDRSDAAIVDDFKMSGIDDCTHDAIVGAWIDAAEMETGIPFEAFATHLSSLANPCAEGALQSLGTVDYHGILTRSLLLWNVAGSPTVLGRVTSPSPTAIYGRYLREYVASGGSVVIWGLNPIGAMLGDFHPNNDPYTPVGGGAAPNFDEDTFVWTAGLRTTFDRPRGIAPELQLLCSGIVGLEATPTAIAEGYPAGVPDPTGAYPDRTALWVDDWAGFENPSAWKGAVAMTGDPPLHLAGLDTLYTIVTNSIAWQHAGTEACGEAGMSPIEGGGIVTRYRDPNGTSGGVVWIGTPLFMFNGSHAGDVATILSKLAAWAAER